MILELFSKQVRDRGVGRRASHFWRPSWCGKKNLNPRTTLGTGLEGPGYAARRAELRRKAQEAARTRKGGGGGGVAERGRAERRDRRRSDKGKNTRVGRPRGGMKVAARIGERLRREIGRGGRPRVGDG